MQIKIFFIRKFSLLKYAGEHYSFWDFSSFLVGNENYTHHKSLEDEASGPIKLQHENDTILNIRARIIVQIASDGRLKVLWLYRSRGKIAVVRY